MERILTVVLMGAMILALLATAYSMVNLPGELKGGVFKHLEDSSRDMENLQGSVEILFDRIIALEQTARPELNNSL